MISPVHVIRTVACALAVSCATVPVVEPAQGPDQISRRLRKDVTMTGMMQHMQRLQNIALANGGTRASGTAGYAASRDYAVGQLKAAGLDVSLQQFTFDFYRQTGPASFSRTSSPPRIFTEAETFHVMDHSGPGAVSGVVQAVDVNFADPSIITSGCDASDFADFTPGNVALLQRGTCKFLEKVRNAQTAGAAAAIVFNQGDSPGPRTVLFTATLEAPVQIPAISVSFALGEELAAAGTTASITTQTESETRPTWNVLAELAPRNPRNAGKTVLVGAHLDSVLEGAGINDNGSGVAAILEIAEKMTQYRAPPNPVRFALWGAEEGGLLGSSHYVASLGEAELAKIGLNLNFDMLGSPNFARLVLDGDGSDTPAAGPAGSD
jgi:Zn-dependent M28 family amino/carboxypeptidase